MEFINFNVFKKLFVFQIWTLQSAKISMPFSHASLYLSSCRSLQDLTADQLQALEEFRKFVAAQGAPNSLFDDHYLLRFLRARKFDLPKTQEMWTSFLKWRQEHDVDNLDVNAALSNLALSLYYNRNTTSKNMKRSTSSSLEDSTRLIKPYGRLSLSLSSQTHDFLFTPLLSNLE